LDTVVVACLEKTFVLEECDFTKVARNVVALQMLAFIVLLKIRQDFKGN